MAAAGCWQFLAELIQYKVLDPEDLHSMYKCNTVGDQCNFAAFRQFRAELALDQEVARLLMQIEGRRG